MCVCVYVSVCVRVDSGQYIMICCVCPSIHIPDFLVHVLVECSAKCPYSVKYMHTYLLKEWCILTPILSALSEPFTDDALKPLALKPYSSPRIRKRVLDPCHYLLGASNTQI